MREPRLGPTCVVALAATLVGLLWTPGTAGATAELPAAPRGERCFAPGPKRIELEPTRRNAGAAGYMELVPATSPFGVTVSRDGRYVYDVRVRLERLRRRPGETYIAWAATPNLDKVRKLGVIGPELETRGRVDWNKFLVFVSVEASPEVERWQGSILLTAASPSSLMHTMAGHGIFEAHTGPC